MEKSHEITFPQKVLSPDRDDALSYPPHVITSYVENVPAPYRLYKERWFGIGLIFCLGISIPFCWLSFGPVANISSRYFGVSLTAIDMLATEYMLVFVVVSPFSCWFIEKYGIKYGLLLAALLNASGAWIRYLATFLHDDTARFSVVVIGQTVCALADTFSLPVPVKYAMTWFDERERTTAVMIASNSVSVGSALASVIVPYLVPTADKVPVVLLVTSIFGTVLVVPAVLLRERPPTPPTYTAVAPSGKFIPSIREIMKNKNFIILLISFSIVMGLQTAFNALVSVILVPYGYTTSQAGTAGAVMTIAGLIGGAMTSPLVDRFHLHKYMLKIGGMMLGVTLFCFTFVVKENNFVVILVFCGTIGFILLSLIAVVLELGVECTYPVSASASSTVLWFGTSIWGVVATVAMDRLREQHGPNAGKMIKSLWFQGISGLLAGLIVLLFHSRDLRREAEKSEKDIRKGKF